MTALDLQISIEDDNWSSEDKLVAFCSRVLESAADYLHQEEEQPLLPHPIEVSLVFTNDEQIREINAEWRDKDKATNVLSFPAYPIEPGDTPGPMLGDIVLARETVERESVDLEKPFDDHLTHLLVHGFLHLFGYDHMNVEDAEEMEGLETRILARLGLSDPYAGQDPL
jgi:probable rRNA maturation factor